MFMSNISDKITNYYDFLFVELADPRTNDWLFIRNPFPALTILALYLYFVISWGPKFMKDRQPFELKTVLVVYNFLQVVISIFIFVSGARAGWLTTYNWTCEPVDFSYTPQAIWIARLVHVYFLSKLSELLDTVFFVLRKKNNQITFLHIYHHTVMPMISWATTKYYPGGHGTFIGFINSFVHIIMYAYYLLAATGPQFQKYLWWKKYITTMQMSQFCLAFLHNSQLLFKDCGFPRWSVFFTLPNAVFFYFLFADFYNKAYSPEKNTKTSSDGIENINYVSKVSGASRHVPETSKMNIGKKTNEVDGKLFATKID